MSYKPYFGMINFNAVDTLYSGVSFLSFGNYSSSPSFNWTNNIWNNSYYFAPGVGLLSNSSSLEAPKSLTKSSALPASNSYDFGSFKLSSTPALSASSGKVSGKTSYKPVSGNAKGGLGAEFLARVKEVAQNINCDYKDLLAVMNSESGLDPSIQNQAGYQAYGLIQFTPSTARELGTSVDKLVKMSAVEQLDYVEKFYLNARKTRGFGNKKFTAADLYAITFLPARANQNVLCVEGERWESGRKKGQLKKWYEANTVFDKNKDGKIEKWELQEQMNACRVNENIFLA